MTAPEPGSSATRRDFLAVAAAGVATAEAGGVLSRGEGPAHGPWRSWDQERELVPSQLVVAGVLAANAHDAHRLAGWWTGRWSPPGGASWCR